MFCWLVPWRCRMFQMLWLDYSHNRRVIGTQVVLRWQRSDPNNPSTHQVRLPYHFYPYGGHIEFIRELWHAQGAIVIAQYLLALFGQKENFTIYFSGKRRSLLHPNTAQLTIFFPHYNLFLGKISIGNSMNCSAFGINNTSDISKLFYKIEIWDNFEISQVVFMPNIMYKSCYYLFNTTTGNIFVIFTCRYFKLSWNTTALSQSNCRNFSCRSISPKALINTERVNGIVLMPHLAIP